MFIRCPYCGSEDVRQFFPIGSGYKCLECGRIMDASLDWKRIVPATPTLGQQVEDLASVVARLEKRLSAIEGSKGNFRQSAHCIGGCDGIGGLCGPCYELNRGLRMTK